jgi:hypothetical protein
MNINIVSFAYLFVILSPFVIASYFTLTSFFDLDFKGIIYLAGLVSACFFGVFLGNSGLLWFVPYQKPNNAICNMISINQITEISRLLPLGPIILGYTFAYICYAIVKHNFIYQNVNTLIFFTILILFDMIWRVRNFCNSLWQVLASLFMGGLVGLLWAFIVNSTNDKKLVIITGINNKEICSTPKHPKFKCTKSKKTLDQKGGWDK